MRGRLLYLLRAWAEREMIAINGRGLRTPNSGYVWRKDKLGHYHFGRYDLNRHFIQGEEAVIHVSFKRGKRSLITYVSRVEEFGCAIRKLDETSQGLIILSYLGSEEEWRSYLGEKRLRDGQADKWLKKAVLILMRECRRRGLV